MQSPTMSQINNFFKIASLTIYRILLLALQAATADHEGGIRRCTGKLTQSSCILKLCFKHGCTTAL